MCALLGGRPHHQRRWLRPPKQRSGALEPCPGRALSAFALRATNLRPPRQNAWAVYWPRSAGYADADCRFSVRDVKPV
jgi:hypothetical protein